MKSLPSFTRACAVALSLLYAGTISAYAGEQSKTYTFTEVVTYDYVGDFHEGLAKAKKGGVWLHIMRDGKAAYESRYELVGNFHEGLAWVRKDGVGFHITHNGKAAYEGRYDQVGDFSNGIAWVVKDNLGFYINHNGLQQYNGLKQ